MSEDFICRGISKDNKFVYGYYFLMFNKHYILEPTKLKNKEDNYDILCLDFLGVEITQAPDRWSGELDEEGNKIWQKDKLKTKYGDIVICKFGKVGQNSQDTYSSNGLSLVADKIWGGNSQFCETPYYKIIGNTHGIEDNQ